MMRTLPVVSIARLQGGQEEVHIHGMVVVALDVSTTSHVGYIMRACITAIVTNCHQNLYPYTQSPVSGLPCDVMGEPPRQG